MVRNYLHIYTHIEVICEIETELIQANGTSKVPTLRYVCIVIYMIKLLTLLILYEVLSDRVMLLAGTDPGEDNQI